MGKIPFKFRMLAAQSELAHHFFDKQCNMGGGRGYGYASHEMIQSKTNEIASSLGIIIESDEQIVQFERGEKAADAVVHVRVRWLDVFSDEYATSTGVGSGRDVGDKSVMKASTAAFKYALVRKFMGCWGEQDPEAFDPDKDSKSKDAYVASDRKPSARKWRQ